MTFESLTPQEVERVLALVPPLVRLQMRRENIVIAGGIIRDTLAGLEPKDIDIFCHSEEQARRLAEEVSAAPKHTTFAYTVSAFVLPVQYVFYKDFTTPEDLISQFDFRACALGIYYDFARQVTEGVAVAGAREDCVFRDLYFMKQQKDAGKLAALRRALNFAPKGWTISNDELASIIMHWQDPEPPQGVLTVRRYVGTHEDVVRAFRPCYGRV